RRGGVGTARRGEPAAAGDRQRGALGSPPPGAEESRGSGGEADRAASRPGGWARVSDPTLSPQQADEAKERIRNWGRSCGLSALGVAPPEPPTRSGYLLDWLRLGRHGSMHYLARDPAARGDPTRMLDGCRSVLCAALDYHVDADPSVHAPGVGRISRYAWGDDYHDVFKEKLRGLAARIEEEWPETRTRVTVDTAPVLEKELAAAAGIGWIGKHTNVIDPDRGSWFFLGEIFTNLPLPRDAPISDHCGSCVRCIEICPTDAIDEPYRLDATKCLSYWNIEHRGEIDSAIRPAMENWIFGCDLCQEVCPWNREPAPAAESRFEPRRANLGRPLRDWIDCGPEEYRDRFRRSAVKRARYDGFRRNVQVAWENERMGKGQGASVASGGIRLYGASWSPETRVAARFLQRHGVEFELIHVDRDPDAARALQEATGSRLVPVLRLGEEWIAAWSRRDGLLREKLAVRLGLAEKGTAIEDEER
ncbi:MAG: tRNA epoxyqueuosine(34) reductase QueG, partial [Candidatus Latescibacteria bacterium]|nr:tRNA epoxyqueuosine(34) reductase QueG [Candidatus Latescibacterota bacterium]